MGDLKSVSFDKDLISTVMEKFATKKGFWGKVATGFKIALPIIAKVGTHIAANAIAPGIGSLIVAGVDALLSAGG